MDINDQIALIRLLDDPDPNVIELVWKKIIEIGAPMIPFLDEAWKKTAEPQMLENIEQLIRSLRLSQLSTDLTRWTECADGSLLEGAWLLCRIQFPDLQIDDIRGKLKPIRNEIWLELNNNLTALEKIKVVNYYLFQKHHFRINVKHPDSPGSHFFNTLIDTKQGNPISLAIFYSILCIDLGLPVYGVDIPGSIVLVYHDLPLPLPVHQIDRETPALFYINPVNRGAILGHKEILYFLTQNRIKPVPARFRACKNDILIYKQLLKLEADYRTFGNLPRAEQVNSLIKLWLPKES